MKFDVYSVGNALMDMLVEVPEETITELKLNKGQQQVTTEQQSRVLFEKIKYVHATIAAGGGAANAIATLAQLGAQAAFCGMLGDDEYGEQYEIETQRAGVHDRLKKTLGITGHVAILITPDAERTMAVNLGVSTQIKKTDINENDIAQSKIVHVDGYQIEQATEVCMHVLNLAKKNNVEISIDASDPGIIKRNKEQFMNVLTNYATILFANEEEARELTGKSSEEAIFDLGKMCKTAIIKCGKQGSLITHQGEVHMIECVQANAIDTTGAGDAYAAGFLYGYLNNYPIEKAGKLASTLAAKVVEQIGARLDKETVEKVKSAIN
ncbi:MAG TPA: adenosine kinase [Candidatus Nanoarchaeia archaeon]|nr:adenosine kinase [Candidatus Nanoarchaeia archaeon]